VVNGRTILRLIDLKEIECEVVDQINIYHNRIQRRAFVTKKKPFGAHKR
jgi:hypothetical protein